MLNEIEVGLICLSERKKFKEVYEEYFTALKYFAMRYVKDEEVACDLLQDVFVKLWEKGDRFENEMQLKTYLYRVVRNHCLTYIRDAQRKEKRMEGFEVEETEELPDACRNVYMKSLEGKSHKEIAEELHIAITTIKKHKTNANNYLRERLKGLLCFMIYLGI